MTVVGSENVQDTSLTTDSKSTPPKSGPPETAKSSIDTKQHHPTNIMDSDYKYQFTSSTITGVLHFQNAGAFDWSINGFLAYGCQNKIVILDTNNTMKYCQTLHRHKHIVSLVRWSPETNFILCSVDISGVIIIWNVLEAQVLNVITSTNETKQINWLHWITVERKSSKTGSSSTTTSTSSSSVTTSSSSSSSEIVVKSPYLIDLGLQSRKQLMEQKNDSATQFILIFSKIINSFILYDTENCSALARWTPEYKITHAEFNPFFSFNRSCDSSVFNLSIVFKSSQNNDDRFYIGIARIHEIDFRHDDGFKETRKLNLSFECFVLQNSIFEQNNLLNRVQNNSRSSRFDNITRLERDKFKQCLVQHESGNHSSSQTGPGTNDHSGLIHIEFNKSMRNQIFIVFPRDIYLIDLLIETVIAVIPIERNCSKIQRIFSCSHRNSFYVFHESGNVSFRLYQKKIITDRSNLSPSTPDVPNEIGHSNDNNYKNASFLNVSYINLCQSEQIRLTKQNKILASSMSPFDETKIAFLLSSGRVLIKSLICQKMDKTDSELMGVIVNHTLAMPLLSDLIKPQEYQLGAFLLAPGDHSTASSQSTATIAYKILVTQCINGLGAAPTAIRMCPPLTYLNINHHRPYLAVGDALGVIQIWFLKNNTASLHREFSVHSYSVSGIEWTSLTSLISFSYPTISSPSHRDSTSGFSLSGIVAGSGSSSGRVTNELVHIDITTGKVTPFRTNRCNDSSPIETVRVSFQKQYMIILFKNGEPFEIWDVKTLTLLKVMSPKMSHVSAVEWSPIKSTVSKLDGCDDDNRVQKENFIVTNKNLFHCSIEGTHLKELSCFPPDADNSHINVTSIAWKNDLVLIGDASGALNLWHLKNKSCKTDSSLRGSVKKLRFAPGKGIYKCLVLYADFGVDIWEISEFVLLAQLKYPRDSNFKIIDIDWAGSEYPVLATADGFIFITNTKLKTYSSPIQYPNYDRKKFQMFTEKIVNKNGLVPDSMFNLKLNINVNFLGLRDRKELLRNFLFSFKEDEHSELDLRQYLHTQIIISRIFSSQNDCDFWNILQSILYGEELDSRLDLYLDSKQYRQLQQELLMLLESNRKTYEHAHTAYQMNLRLKNFRRAVQILLDTDVFHQNTNSDTFYLNALKACLITALQGDSQPSLSGQQPQQRPLSATGSVLSRSGVFFDGDASSDFEISVDEPDTDGKEVTRLDAVAPVVKLVATSLIASGSTLQGVELLNFISKNADSCRYLQSADKWLESVWLAKSSLDQHDCTEVLRRWCDMLTGSELDSDQQIVFKVYLSRRHFSRVLRGLNRVHDLKSFPFAVCCVAGQLIDLESNRDILEEIFDRFVSYFYSFDSKQIQAIKRLDDDADAPTDAADNDHQNCEKTDDLDKFLKDPQILILKQFWRLFTVPK